MKGMINHIKVIKMDAEIGRIGERGQIVIPQEMREKLNIKKGEKFLMIRHDENIIIRPMKKIKSLETIEEDVLDMQIADKRWKEIEEGNKKVSSREDFLKEMESW